MACLTLLQECPLLLDSQPLAISGMVQVLKDEDQAETKMMLEVSVQFKIVRQDSWHKI